MNKLDFDKLMRKSDKGTHHGYQRFYFSLFKEFEFSDVRLLEIGVENGKSMDIWKQFFTKANHIYGIGYKNHQTKYMEKVDDNMTLFMGDQSNKNFLKRFICDCGGNLDIVIDDGSHVPSHIQTSFEMLWKHVNTGGLYIIEDVETSYWKKISSIYGYSLKNEGSIVEYFKTKVDELNNEFRNKSSSDIAMITFVQNMIIIKKVSEDDYPYMDRKYRYLNKIA